MADCNTKDLNAALAISTSQACKYVTTACAEYEFVNFFWYRYCFLEKGTGLHLTLFVLTMVISPH